MVTLIDQDVDVAAAYCAHRLPLLRLAVMLVDDLHSAEDVVQDAFAGLHRNAKGITNPDALAGYLRTAVVNHAHSLLRRRGTARAHLRVAEPDVGDAADFELLLAEEHREVFAAVRQLPPKQREVIVLRYWSGLSEAEIARTLDISRGSVKSQASRAMDKLEAILEASR